MSVPGNLYTPTIRKTRGPGYTIDYALALDGSADALSKTFGVAPDSRRKFTVNLWYKPDLDGSGTDGLFGAGTGATQGRVHGNYNSTNGYISFEVYHGSGWYSIITSAYYRDPSNWYNFTFVYDIDNATSADRLQIWEGPTRLTAFSSETQPSTTFDHLFLSNSTAMYIGYNPGDAIYTKGRLAAVAVLDNVAEPGTSFCEFSSTTPTFYQPVSVSGLTYGTNGALFDFAVAPGTGNGAGTDVSGNGNHFTDVSLTTASQIVDTPSNNFAVLNPLKNGGHTIANNNLNCVLNWGKSIHGTIGIPVGRTSDKFVFEAKFTAFSAQAYIGVVDNGERVPAPTNDSYSYTNGFVFRTDGVVRGLNPTRGYSIGETNSSGNTFAVNDVLGFEVDCSNGDVKVYKNGTFFFTQSALPGISALPTDRDWFPTTGHASGGGSGTVDFTFEEADMTYFANYASGSKSICTANLPEPAIKDPSDHFYSEVVTHDGTSTASTCSFDLDTYEWLCIIKNTAGAVEKWYWIDSLRGVTKYLDSTSNGTETTDANVLTVSGTTFTLGSTLGAKDYLVEFHKAGLAADTAANSEGTITTISTSVNTTSGFSISTWAGTSTNGTFGHGLTSAPEFNIVKVLGTYNWAAWHTSLTDGTYWLRLNTNAAQAVDAGQWNSTVPSSTLISVGNGSGNTNITGNNSVSYSWHSVEGYSYFGSYEGNGNADGPFINSGLADGVIIVKCIDAANGWASMNKAAGLYNPHVNFLQFNSTAIGSTDPEDLVSNGLKVRNAGGSTNATSTLIYCQIGGTPFKYARGR
jgi:hypothetical protein